MYNVERKTSGARTRDMHSTSNTSLVHAHTIIDIRFDVVDSGMQKQFATITATIQEIKAS